MKRSEMIEIIEGMIKWADHHSPKVKAIEILTVIEEEGMLPPDYLSPTGCPCGLPGCTSEGIVNEWEPEDE